MFPTEISRWDGAWRLILPLKRQSDEDGDECANGDRLRVIAGASVIRSDVYVRGVRSTSMLPFARETPPMSQIASGYMV